MRIKSIGVSDIILILFFVIASKCFYLIDMPSGYGLGSNIQLEALVMVAFFIYYRFRIRGIYSNNILFFLIFILFDCLFTKCI